MPGYSRSLALQSPTTQAWLLLIGLVVTVAAGWFVLGQTRKLSEARTVEATVRLSRVHEEQHPGSEESETHYSPEIEYEYVVDGRAFRSRTVFLDNVSTTHAGWAQGWVNRYPAGGRVRAYHDPKHPERAFLVRFPSFIPYGFVLFGLLLMTGAFSTQPSRFSFGRRQVRIGAGEVYLGFAALVVSHFGYVWLITRGG